MTPPQVTPSPASWITDREDPSDWFNSITDELRQIEHCEGYK